MIEFDKFNLANGLRVLVHEDNSSPMAVVNILYDVGARDEDEEKTGFAHLFEHLMFGGSKNIPVYDEPLQLAGGENNAYTSNDLTNYYCQLPAENLETAFWLESDRMLSLAFSKKSLEVQRKVVSEEFKEHYLNKPYGNVWHELREMAYTTHPYKWMTIGKSLKHFEDASLQDVKDFFKKHYTPANAIMVVAGNIKTDEVKKLAEKWFADIPGGNNYARNLPVEPPQTEARFKEIKADVPLDALYKCYHMCARDDEGYYSADLLSDILSGSGSSRLFQKLLKEKQIFSSIECYQMGSLDAGLMVIEGMLVKGINIKDADEAVVAELELIKQNPVTDFELEKVKNKTESTLSFEDMSLTSRAASIAMHELMGNAADINTELKKYRQVTKESLKQQAEIIFDKNNCSTLYYLAKG